MKKYRFCFAALIFILALLLAVSAACAPKPDEPTGPSEEQTSKLPSYEQTANTSIRSDFSADVSSYKIFEGAADSVYDQNDQKVDFTVEGGATYLSSSVLNRSGKFTFKVFTDKTLTYAEVILVSYVSTPEEFYAINSNLDGYYELKNDVDFAAKGGTVIGRAPLVSNSSNGYSYDKTGRGSTAAQVGVPFTGTFDGKGFTISNFNLAYSPTVNSKGSYCMAMFAYVGEGATVSNFRLKNSAISSGYYGAFIAGVNLGTISSVTVDKDCTLAAQYADCGGIAIYSGGTLADDECYVLTAKSSSEVKNLKVAFEDSGKNNNCYIGNPYPVKYEVTSGDGMEIIEGLTPSAEDFTLSVTYSDGSVGTIDAVSIGGYDPNGAVGTAQQVKVFYGSGEKDYVSASITPIAKSVSAIALCDGYKTEYVVGDASLDFSTLYIDVSYNNGTTEKVQVTPAMVASSQYDLNSSGRYEITVSYGNFTCKFAVSVVKTGEVLQSLTLEGSPAVSEYLLNGTVQLSDLEGLTLIANYSGGSSFAVDITKSMLSYDFSEEGATEITITYGSLTAKVSVSVRDYVTGLSVKLKGDSKVLTYSADALPDFNEICVFEAVMASGKKNAVTEVVASNYRAGLCSGVNFTYGEFSVQSEIEFEIWYLITRADEWSKINDNLAGYYRLSGDLTLDKDTSAVIGVAPLRHISADEGYEVSPTGTDRPGVAFTGKFDGGGHKIIGFTSAFSGAPYAVESYALTLFAYVGSGAYVGNFTLSGASIRCGQAGSFIAALNMGEISDVTIDADCSLFVHYGRSTPAVAVVNGGKIVRVTCYVNEYTADSAFGENHGSGPITTFVKQTVSGGIVTDCNFVTGKE